MPQLDPTWFVSQLFWLAVTFSLLWLLLAKAVLPPLLRVIEQREALKKSDLQRAEELKNQAEHARERYERTLADARLRSQQVFADAQMSIKQRIDNANAEMDRAMAEKLKQASASIHAQQQEIFSQMMRDGVGLVTEMVEKFTHQKPDAATVASALESVRNLR